MFLVSGVLMEIWLVSISVDDNSSKGKKGHSLLVVFLVNILAFGLWTMAIKHGELVTLEELNPSSPFFKQGASVRVTGKLQEYTVETAIAVVADGNATLKIDTQHLRDISFRIGSTYQFIGELLIQPDSEAILQARVGRIVDGIDLSLYHQSLQLLRQFQADHLNNSTS